MAIYLALLPRNGLFVRPGRHGDGARFAAQFVAAWRGVPLGARRALLRDWRWFRQEHGDPLRPCPEIELSLVAAQGRGFARESFAAAYFPDLRHFSFWIPAIVRLPDELLRTLIAHELGHAYVASRDGETPGEEAAVRDLVEREWGFDEGALTRWLGDNREELWLDYQRRLGLTPENDPGA